MNLKDPRPYVFLAHIQWLDESGAKPHLVIQNGPKTLFPPAFHAHSTVTFNISAEAVKGLQVDQDGLSFSARFSGKEFNVFAPLDCLLQLFSFDQRVRIGLQRNPEQQPQPIEQTLQEPEIPIPSKPSLTVISGGSSSSISRGKLSMVPRSAPEPDEPDEPDKPDEPDEPDEPECA